MPIKKQNIILLPKLYHFEGDYPSSFIKKNFIKCLLCAGSIPAHSRGRWGRHLMQNGHGSQTPLDCLCHIPRNEGLTQKAPPSFSLIFSSRPLILQTWFIVRPATKDHRLSRRKCHIKRIYSCLGWGRGQWFWPSTWESWPIRRCLPTGIAICFPRFLNNSSSHQFTPMRFKNGIPRSFLRYKE